MKIKSIEEITDTHDYWDITVEDNHNFVLADGSVVHNCGTGVGFSVESKYVNKLPTVAEEFHDTDTTIIVPDSRIGWASSLREFLSLLYSGRIPKYDLSKVRPAGARLKTFGGRASGPEPLGQLFEFATQLFKAAAGRKLTTLEVHDLVCRIADVVIVGGVRRSALISLSDLGDSRLAYAKAGQWFVDNPHRALANNSAVYDSKPDLQTFINEWRTLYASKSGERGIFNRLAATKQAINSRNRINDGEPIPDYGTNPCVTGDTIIATINGPRTFKELADEGEDVLVYSWHPDTKLPVVRWMRRPHKTRSKHKILKVGFDSGLYVKMTYDHCLYSFRGNKIRASDLVVGQSIRAFSMSLHRDGHLRVHAWDSQNDRAVHQWVSRMVWENGYGTIPDACIIHHADKNSLNNNLSNLRLLTVTEHNKEHYQERFENGFDGKCKNHKVISIEDAGYEDVYNGCVDDSHTYIILDSTPVSGVASGIVSANCGEIILRSGGLCNLSEVIVRHNDTSEDLREKVRLAAILGTFQSTLTDFRYLRKVWKQNAEEERLLGVSLTGIYDNSLTFNPQPEMLQELKEIVIQTNKEYADKLGISPSVATTCVKPSGTVSQLADCSSGIHPAYSSYYIRSVRMDNKDPICTFLKEQGVKNEPELNHPDSQTVFYFPRRSFGKARHSVSALSHLNLYRLYRENWCEHNPSVTVYYGDDEFLDVGSWVWKNWDDIGGIAFLPRSDHVYKQAPYQEITKSEYSKMIAEEPEIDWSKYYEYETEDHTTAVQDLACSSGVCEL